MPGKVLLFFACLVWTALSTCTEYTRNNVSIPLLGGATEFNDTLTVNSSSQTRGVVLTVTFDNVDFNELAVQLRTPQRFPMDVFNGSALCSRFSTPPPEAVNISTSLQFSCEGGDQGQSCPLLGGTTYAPLTDFDRIDGSNSGGEWALFVMHGNDTTGYPELVSWTLTICDSNADLDCGGPIILDSDDENANIWERADLWITLFLPLLCIFCICCVLLCFVIILSCGAVASAFALGSYYTGRMLLTDVDYL